ncbi:hypothetical protein L7F22_009417 [Adiantum nelumboides]|nr:hypothetical protein [Adiantum nelumboides]
MDWFPVVSQLKSFVQVCSGDEEGARRTQENFSKQCPGVSQVRSLVEAAFVSDEAAAATQREFLKAQAASAMATPGLGHAIGAVQYIVGDVEGGDNSMKAASRTTGVVLGGAGGLLVGGPVGAAAGGVAGGALMDGLTTSIDSAVHQQYRPSGTIALIEETKQRDAKGAPISGHIFDTVAGVVFDGVGGAKQAKGRSGAKGPRGRHL